MTMVKAHVSMVNGLNTAGHLGFGCGLGATQSKYSGK